MKNKSLQKYDYEKQARLFKTLMHPARLAILDILRYGEHCVCHLEAALGYRQAYISQQLMLLRDAGVIEDRREGWNIFYRVINPGIYTIIDAACQLTGAYFEADVSKQMEKPLSNCPCPKCNADKEYSPNSNTHHACPTVEETLKTTSIEKENQDAPTY